MWSRIRKFAALALLAAILAGCATEPTPTQTGAVVGAAGGAAIGGAVGGGRGAALGALIGGLTGALVGDVAGQQQRRPLPPPPPPPPGPSTIPSQPPSGAMVPGSYMGDPTKGTISNTTRWEVHVFIDQQPGQASSPTLILLPQQSAPVNLDIGNHRIQAEAYIQTQFGRRTVGAYDQMVRVDAKSTGWSIRFIEQNF